MNLVTLPLALLIALSTLPALLSRAEDQGGPARKDLDRMQGEWALVSGVADGYAIPEAMRKDFRRVCKGDEVATTVGGRVVIKATVKLDPAKSPKTIDFAVTDGPTKGKTQLGIYAIEGDTFKSCFAAPGGERPTDFTSKPGDGRTATEWKRATPPAKNP